MNKVDENPSTMSKALRNSLITAAVLYFIDAIWLGQGAIAFVVILIVLFFTLPRIMWAGFKKNLPLRNLRAAKAAIYLTMAAATLSTIWVDLQFARQHAETVVAALKQFQARHGHYPNKLPELVPEFLPAVPNARFSLTLNTFYYRAMENSHTLSYVVIPPFGMTSHNLETGNWTVKD